jgi:serine/threonine protein kinase
MECDKCGHVNPEGSKFCAGCGGHLPQGTPDASYPLIGQVVGGRYHIVGLIGEGGMGVVYKAEQRLGSTVRKVAVKTLHAELSRDPSITARFHREVGTVAQLEHPNTVRVYDFGSTDDGTLYIAMEFLAGRALNKVIESEGALDPRRTALLIRQVAGSLEEAHRQGIIHRDLKPENVLLIERAGEKDVVKLVDFGIAARTESADREKEQKLTQQGMVLGTPPYMSPEQFTGKALDARSDVYSLGVMTYEMLTGQLPFQADTPWQWATHHMTSQPRSFDEIPSGHRIPEAVRRTVLKALSKEPADRQNGASQFYEEFAAALGGVTSAVPPVAPSNKGNKTEAMAEAPAFAMAATEGMPAAPALPARSPLIASPPVALPPAPPRESAGGKGLVYGLGGAVVVLGLAIGAIALSSGSKESPPLDFAATQTPAAPPPAEIAPEVSPSVVEKPAPEPERASSTSSRPDPAPKPATKPAAANKPASSSSPPPATNPAATASKPPTTPPTATPSAPAPAATPSPIPPATAPANPLPSLPRPQPSAPATRPPAQTLPSIQPPAGLDPCAACIKAAMIHDYRAAAQFYGQCTNAAQKNTCQSRVAPLARRDAEFRAKNEKCSEARDIEASAVQMGVPAGQFAQARGICSK